MRIYSNAVKVNAHILMISNANIIFFVFIYVSSILILLFVLILYRETIDMSIASRKNFENFCKFGEIYLKTL